MREIQLTQGQVALVDDEDYEELSQFTWCAHYYKSMGSFYADRNVYCGGKHSTVKMHRVVLGDPEGLHVDHIDHFTLNNQKYNLRACTASQNACNRKLRSDSSTGAKGVTIHKRTGQFRVQVTFNKNRTEVGLFDTLEEAVEARKIVCIAIHGEFAYDGMRKVA